MAPHPHRRYMAPVLAAALLAAGAPAAAEDVESRLDRVERLLESRALAELSNRQERLQRQMAELAGEMDDVRSELEDVRRRQEDLFGDLDDRLMALEQSGPRDGGDDDPPEPALPELDADTDAEDLPDPDEAEAAGEGDAAARYEQAFEQLQAGDYGAAGDGFREIVDDYGDSDYADNARYWLAETYYVTDDYDEAMGHFEAIIDAPESSKHPDALLKAGYIHYERSEWEQARERLEAVLEAAPDSTVADLARNRLERMDEEGR